LTFDSANFPRFAQKWQKFAAIRHFFAEKFANIKKSCIFAAEM
jgi:hypothetical protein